MSDYQDGKNVLLQMPQPGRPVASKKQIVEKVVEKENKIDTDAIADAVIKAISGKMIVTQGDKFVSKGNEGSFDNSESLKKIADAMIVQGNSDSKLEGLGRIKETEKDKKETDKTIDILSQLGD